MKSELRVKAHSVLPGAQMVEVWYGGEMVATVTGADGPGVRVVLKYRLEMREPVQTLQDPDRPGGYLLPGYAEIRVTRQHKP